jgi:ElaA protein
VQVNVAHLADIDPVTLYCILQLRSAVFVVEQNCAYPDLDGRDLEPDARQLWIERDGKVAAALRILGDPVGARIGRVVTAPDARADGLGGLLMQRALALTADADVVLDAQAYLETWYERFDFVRCGAPFLEDGIWHVPMIKRAGLRR